MSILLALQGGGTNISYTAIGGAVTSGAADETVALTLGAATPVVTDHGVLAWAITPSGSTATAGGAGVALVVQGQGGVVATGTGSPFAISYGATGGAATSGAAGVELSISSSGAATTSGTGQLAVSYGAQGGAVTGGGAGVELSVQGQGGVVATGTGSPFVISYTASGGAVTSGSAGVALSITASGGATTTGSSALDMAYLAQGGAVTGGSASYSITVAPRRSSGGGGGGSSRYGGGKDWLNEFVRVEVLPKVETLPQEALAEVVAYNEEALLGQLAEAKKRLAALAMAGERARFYALEIAALQRRVQDLEARIIGLAREGAASAVRAAVLTAKTELLGQVAETNRAARYAGAAALTAGVTYFVVPDKMAGLKEIGYTVAAGFAVKALIEHLKS